MKPLIIAALLFHNSGNRLKINLYRPTGAVYNGFEGRELSMTTKKVSLMITEKDKNTLINKINTPLSSLAHARVLIKNASPALCQFYENNAEKINAEVIVIRGESDESLAAKLRNSTNQVLFIFSEKYWVVPDYFAGVSKAIELPKALLKRLK